MSRKDIPKAFQKRVPPRRTDSYPLLVEGLPTITTAPGEVRQQNFRIKSNRGYLTEIMPLIRDYRVPTLANQAGQGYRITITIGSQVVLKDEPLDRWSQLQDFGTKEEQRIRIRAQEAQTITVQIDGRDAFGLTDVSMNLMLYYSNDSRDCWLDNLEWSKSLSMKRQSFHLIIPNASAAGTFQIDDVIPRNNGPVIGASLYLVGEEAARNNSNLTLRVNGVDMILELPGVYVSDFAQRTPYVFKFDFEPGSQFQLINRTTGTLNITFIYVTFYFNA